MTTPQIIMCILVAMRLFAAGILDGQKKEGNYSGTSMLISMFVFQLVIYYGGFWK